MKLFNFYSKKLNYDEIRNQERSTQKSVQTLINLIRIEKGLLKKLDDNFYKQINHSNYSENLNFIVNNIKDDSNEKLFSEVYRNEEILKEKIKFFTYFQIFNDDLYNLDVSEFEGVKRVVEHEISYDSNVSINENFIIKLQEILKITSIPFEERVLRINGKGWYVHLKTLILRKVIDNYDRIVGDNRKINELRSLVETCNSFHLSWRTYGDNKKLIRRQGAWKQTFENDNGDIVKGEKVYKLADQIINS